MEYNKPELMLLGNATGLVLTKPFGPDEDGDLTDTSLGALLVGMDD